MTGIPWTPMIRLPLWPHACNRPNCDCDGNVIPLKGLCLVRVPLAGFPCQYHEQWSVADPTDQDEVEPDRAGSSSEAIPEEACLTYMELHGTGVKAWWEDKPCVECGGPARVRVYDTDLLRTAPAIHQDCQWLPQEGGANVPQEATDRVEHDGQSHTDDHVDPDVSG